MDVEVVAAVAACVAAVASLGALGASVYGVRYSTAAAEKLERTRWSRSALADDVQFVLERCERILTKLSLAEPGKEDNHLYTEDLRTAFMRLAHGSPPSVALAAAGLNEAAMKGNLIAGIVCLEDGAGHWNPDAHLSESITELHKCTAKFKDAAWTEMGLK